MASFLAGKRLEEEILDSGEAGLTECLRWMLLFSTRSQTPRVS